MWAWMVVSYCKPWLTDKLSIYQILLPKSADGLNCYAHYTGIANKQYKYISLAHQKHQFESVTEPRPQFLDHI